MVYVSLLIAPLLMLAALRTEQMRGPSAGGWVAALPLSLPVGVVAVAMDSGKQAAAALVWSAAGHVGAQAAFGISFAAGLRRAGLIRALARGVAAYAACSIVIAGLPPSVAAIAAIPALVVAPRFAAGHEASAGAGRLSAGAALTCPGASLVVGAAVVGSRVAGPAVGGALAAFPTISSLLALMVVRREGHAAGAQALGGLVRSLPCYLAFCLAAAVALPALGIAALPLALLAGVAAAVTGSACRAARGAGRGASAGAGPARGPTRTGCGQPPGPHGSAAPSGPGTRARAAWRTPAAAGRPADAAS
jgi:hypothetical protein